jgi:hypothetical protein
LKKQRLQLRVGFAFERGIIGLSVVNRILRLAEFPAAIGDEAFVRRQTGNLRRGLAQIERDTAEERLVILPVGGQEVVPWGGGCFTQARRNGLGGMLATPIPLPLVDIVGSCIHEDR